MRTTILARVMLPAVLSGLVVLLPAASASAHVTVSPATVTPGGYGTLTFKVPTERDDASTIRVEVVVPEELTLTHVSIRPVPGWTATVVRSEASKSAGAASAGPETEARVLSIAWQSVVGIRPGEFQTFDVSMGRLPTKPQKLAFKALQTYSDGTVVRWIDAAKDGGPAPENPAPVVTIAEADQKAPPAAAAATTEDGGTRLLAGAGMLAAIVALVMSAVALLGRRRRVPPAETAAGLHAVSVGAAGS